MIPSPEIKRMKREIVTLDDYDWYIERYGSQSAIAEYFGISQTRVSYHYLKLKSKERSERYAARFRSQKGI